MKRLKFKKPFNGMDNAKKLIPESYKVDGNEFEITDGNETYRVKWSSLINEGIILTSSNKARINEDMSKIKHLMGFKPQETLGTVKGAERLNENKKFGNILKKSKNLLSENNNTTDQDGSKDFSALNNTKKGDKYKISGSNSIRDDIELELVVNANNIVLKGKRNESRKITFKNIKNPKGVKYYAYNKINDKESNWRFAIGDMSLKVNSLVKLEEIDESIKEGRKPKPYPEENPKLKKPKSKSDKQPKPYPEENPELKEPKSKSDKQPKPYPEENPELKEEETSDTTQGDTNPEDTLSKTEIAKTFKKFANTISKANFDLKERDLVTRLLNVVIKLAEEDKSVDPGVKKKFEIFEKELGIINESKNLREQEVGYEESGLNNPELADLNKDDELSPYEEKRGSAIEKAMNEFDEDESITSDIDKENGKREPHVLVGPSGDIALHLTDENGDYILMNTAESIALEEGKYKYFHDQGYSIQPLAIVSDPYDNAEDLNYGVSEANKISHRSIRSGGMGGNLESNPYNNKEVKGKPQGHALRQAGKNEIAYQLANMEPDKEALKQAVWDEEEDDYYRERANGSYEDLYEKKDRFDEVFEGIYEEEDLNEVVSFEDTKYAEEFDDYDDSFYAAKKAWEVKRIPKVKAKVIKMANELNNMISVKDGYGDDVVIKWYDSNAIFNEVEFDENQMTVTYRDYYDRKPYVDTYDLNDYSVYEDGLYDDSLMQVLKKAIKGYKKKTSNIQNKTNFYPYYTVDMDDKRIVDAFETKEDAIYSKKDLRDPSVKIINIKGLERLNLKPINIGS